MCWSTPLRAAFKAALFHWRLQIRDPRLLYISTNGGGGRRGYLGVTSPGGGVRMWNHGVAGKFPLNLAIQRSYTQNPFSKGVAGAKSGDDREVAGRSDLSSS